MVADKVKQVLSLCITLEGKKKRDWCDYLETLDRGWKTLETKLNSALAHSQLMSARRGCTPFATTFSVTQIQQTAGNIFVRRRQNYRLHVHDASADCCAHWSRCQKVSRSRKPAWDDLRCFVTWCVYPDRGIHILQVEYRDLQSPLASRGIIFLIFSVNLRDGCAWKPK